MPVLDTGIAYNPRGMLGAVLPSPRMPDLERL